MDSKDFFNLEETTPVITNNINIKEDVLNSVVNSVETNKTIPNGYLIIKIESTEGRLNAPKELHFRNFYLEDIKELVQYTDGQMLFLRLISVLTNLNYEKFDCSKLHIEELKEIMVKLYLNFISKSLKDMKYPIDDTKPLEGTNIGKTNINLSDLNIIKLNETVKKMFTLKIKNSDVESVTFSFPTINNIVLANKIVEETLKEDIQKTTDIKIKEDNKKAIKNKIEIVEGRLLQLGLELEKELLKEQKDAYLLQTAILNNDMLKLKAEYDNVVVSAEDITFRDSFDLKKKTLYLEIYQKLSIEKINGKEIGVLEKVSSKIDFRYFVLATKEVNKHKFGIDEVLTFFCTHNKKSISRRFSFRLLDFLPSLELSFDTEYDICYDA